MVHGGKTHFIADPNVLHLEAKVEPCRANHLASRLPVKFFTQLSHSIKHSRVIFTLPMDPQTHTFADLSGARSTTFEEKIRT